MVTVMKFNERFAQDDQHHSFTLTADGCMNRMKDDTPFRELELDTRIEPFGRSAEAEERMIQNYVFTLAKHGKHPRADETIERFVLRNMSLIQQW